MPRESIYVEPVTGGYIREVNRIAYAPTAVTKANILLKQPLGAYIYNPEIGNPLLDMNRLPTKTEVVNGIGSCLQPLIANGDIVKATVETYKINAFSKASVTILIVLPTGETANITWKQA